VSVTIVTGLPVGDIPQHLATVKRQLVGTHRLEVLPAGRPWEVTIADVRVIPQPLGTVFSQVMDDEGNLTDARLVEMRIGVLDIGFRTSDYFTLQGFEVIPAQCLTRNTGIAELLLDVSREVSSRYGVETDPHALNDVVLRKTLPVGARTVDISGIVDPLLDRHAEAILAHGRMLWGDEARGLQMLWMTGGGAQLLGARLQELAPHATLVTNARIQNAVGFYRFGYHRGKQARR
jgi:plasmid segregation protein ParM